MANEYSIATIDQTLRQMRLARNHLARRLEELESEADEVRRQLKEVDSIIAQQQGSMFRILTGGHLQEQQPLVQQPQMPSDAEIEAAMAKDLSHAKSAYQQPLQQQSSLVQQPIDQPAPHSYVRTQTTHTYQQIEVKSDRFVDRTIPQAVTMLLREEGGPLHVNEIYTRLLEGGFEFSGNNPTISIAVSLNRNIRFRKVAPGTFDLVMREASQAKA
jgi:hypothetical protein